MKLKTLAASAAALALTASLAAAQTTVLRIQTHFSQETLSGQMAAEFIEDVIAMSNGEIEIEMFYAGAVVKAAETFDAAATGILDCDMTGGAYQTGKNPAFQFTGDLNGGYSNPYQQMAWLLHGGGYDALNELYNDHGMEFIGWWIPGPESLSSTAPIRGVDDFKNWKFRSPPGIITMIFEELGASPIVMDFNEIFTALETGIIDGADAANLTNNIGLGLYDIAKHTNYPGFHSMPADHLACRKDVWDAMPDHHKAILKIGMQALALRNTTINEVKNAQNSVKLAAEGVNLYEWSPEELAKYRSAVQAAWVKFATTPEAESLLNSHLAFLRDIGAME
jgi:TRAP-type mannitol/chloroaromatic compound transport system substrate-binding protein